MRKVLIFHNDYTRMISKVKYKWIYGEGRKLLTSKQILQRLPLALTHVKVGNTSEILLNEHIYKLHILCMKQKKLLKKICNRITTSIKLWNRLNTVNSSKNDKSFDSHRTLINLSEKNEFKKNWSLRCSIKS